MTAMASLRMLGMFLLLCVTLINGQFQDVVDVPKEPPCECVPYYQCVNGTIPTTAGRSIIDPRAKRQTDTSGIRNMEIQQMDPSPSPLPTQAEVRLNECTTSLDVCCKVPIIIPEVTSTTPEPSSQIKPSQGCGRRNPNGVSSALTGAIDGQAQIGEFPWMVALLREEAVEGSNHTNNNYKGGGALIHPQMVLTAAHSVYPYRKDAQALKIRAGEWDTQTKLESFSHQDRKVSEVIIHEGYDDDQLLNDVALLVLRDPVTTAEHIDVVCLPSQGQKFDFSNCFATGWGKNIFGREGRYQPILKKVELPVVPSRPTCQDALRKDRLGPYYQLHESFICAGGNGTADTCTGDGGGPLVCPMANNPALYQQAGIVSWGLACGKNGLPGVYVNVAHFRNWIDQKMAAKNFNTSS